PPRTSRISTYVVRPSWVPPAAPKATPARMAPRISAMALDPLATESVDLVQERNPRQIRLAVLDEKEAGTEREQRDRQQGRRERSGKRVLRSCQVEQAVGAGSDRLAA